MEPPDIPRERACKRPVQYTEGPDEAGDDPRSKKQKPRLVPIYELWMEALQSCNPGCVCNVRDLLDSMRQEDVEVESLRFLQVPWRGHAARTVRKRAKDTLAGHECNAVAMPHLLDGMITLHGGATFAARFWNDEAGAHELFECVQKDVSTSYKKGRANWLVPHTADIMYNKKADRQTAAVWREPVGGACKASAGEECRPMPPLTRRYALSSMVRHCPRLFVLDLGEGGRDESSDDEPGIDDAAERALEDDESDPLVSGQPKGWRASAVARDYQALGPDDRALFHDLTKLYPAGQGPFQRPLGQKRVTEGLRQARVVLQRTRFVVDWADEPVPAHDVDFEALGLSVGVGPEPLGETHVVVAALNRLMYPDELRRVAGAARTRGADLTVDHARDARRLVPRCFKTIVERYGVQAGALGVLVAFFGDRLLVAWLALVAFGRAMDARGLDRDAPREQRWACWMSAGEYLLRFRPLLMDGGLVDVGFGLSYGRDRGMWFGNLLASLEGTRRQELYKTLAYEWMARLEDDNCQECMARFGLAFVAALFLGQERQVTFVSAERFAAEFDGGPPARGVVLPGFFMDTERRVLDPQERGRFALDFLPEYTGLVPVEVLLASMGHVDASAACIQAAIRHLDAVDELELAITDEGQRIVAVRARPVAARPVPAESDAAPDFASLARAIAQARAGRGRAGRAKAGPAGRAGRGAGHGKARAGGRGGTAPESGETPDFAGLMTGMLRGRLMRLAKDLRAQLGSDDEAGPEPGPRPAPDPETVRALRADLGLDDPE